jgi:hypothetical protein
VWPSIVVLSLFHYVECTTLQNEDSEIEGNFYIEGQKIKGCKFTLSWNGESSVGVDAGTPTLLLIHFHLMYIIIKCNQSEHWQCAVPEAPNRYSIQISLDFRVCSTVAVLPKCIPIDRRVRTQYKPACLVQTSMFRSHTINIVCERVLSQCFEAFLYVAVYSLHSLWYSCASDAHVSHHRRTTRENTPVQTWQYHVTTLRQLASFTRKPAPHV